MNWLQLPHSQCTKVENHAIHRITQEKLHAFGVMGIINWQEAAQVIKERRTGMTVGENSNNCNAANVTWPRIAQETY